MQLDDEVKTTKPKKVIKSTELFVPINDTLSLPLLTGKDTYLLKANLCDNVNLGCILNDNTPALKRVEKVVHTINEYSFVIDSGERVLVDTGLVFNPPVKSSYFSKSLAKLVFEKNITSDVLIDDDRLFIVLTNNSKSRVKITNDMFLCELIIIENKND